MQVLGLGWTNLHSIKWGGQHYYRTLVYTSCSITNYVTEIKMLIKLTQNVKGLRKIKFHIQKIRHKNAKFKNIIFQYLKPNMSNFSRSHCKGYSGVAMAACCCQNNTVLRHLKTNTYIVDKLPCDRDYFGRNSHHSVAGIYGSCLITLKKTATTYSQYVF